LNCRKHLSLFYCKKEAKQGEANNMIKGKITNYGLYGDNPLTITTDFIKVERIETTSQPHDWRIIPHIHTDLFQLFLIEHGETELFLTQTEASIPCPCVIVMPANTLHGFNFSPDVRGYVITLSESFVENTLSTSPAVFIELNKVKILSATSEQPLFEALKTMVVDIEKEVFSSYLERKSVLQAFFSIFLIKIYRLAVLKKEQQYGEEVREINHFRRFQKSLRQSPINKKAVSDFAKELNITPVHLNRICQAVAGKSTSQIIQEHSVNEACKYLMHTSYSISEIAHLLNFEDLGYFSRLMKKHLGKSPQTYRKEMSKGGFKF
jgi:AraC family transcriptional regulator, transcriptional activator of pobA